MEPSQTTKRQFVSVNPIKCNGCGVCECVCSLEKEGVIDFFKSRIRVIRLNPLLNVALTCRFCEDAQCVNVCLREAIRQSEGGVLIVDADKCDACKWCIQACPYGGIFVHPDSKVVIACDLCQGEPKCVEFCPESALSLITDDEAFTEQWTSAIADLPKKVERLQQMIEKREYANFEDAEKKTLELEKKIEEMRVKKETGSPK